MKERGQYFHKKLRVWEKNEVLFYGKPIDQNYREQNRATVILADMPSHTEVPQLTIQAISEHGEQIKLPSGEVILWDICPSSQPWLLLEDFKSLKQPVIELKLEAENF